jgi:CRISPR/Cas system-associated endoribonuclease Cas2
LLIEPCRSFAWRAQESVFEGWLDARQRQSLLARLAVLIDAGADRVALYVLAPVERDELVSLGRGLPPEDFRHALL